MEAGTNLSALGVPVLNVVRIRPLLPDEGRAGDLRVTDNQKKIVLLDVGKVQGTSADEYPNDFTYIDSGFEQAYERSIAPMISRDEQGTPGFLEGVNCTIMAFGNSTSGKSYTIEGSGPASRDGVIPSLIYGVFEGIRTKAEEFGAGKQTLRKKTQKWRFKLSLQYIEIVDEKINDLLNPQKMELEINEFGINDGLGIRNLTRKWVDSEDELYHHFRVGQSSRTTLRNEFGNLSERAASVLSLELHQVVTHSAIGLLKPVEEHLFSRFLVVDLPGAEKLAEDPTTLRIREGPTLNQSISSFGLVVKALAQAHDVQDMEFIDYGQSKLTALLPDVLGGSSRTLIFTTIPPADYRANSFVLQFSQLFGKIRNFPVVNDGKQLALLRKFNNQMHLLRQQLAAAGFGGLDVDDRLTNHLLEIHKLEKKIIEDEKTRLALIEEREQLREKLAQVNARVNQLLSEKSSLQQERIQSEEEKLKVSKVLVDLQIENTNLMEQAVDTEFQLQNRILQLENNIVELEMKGQAKQKEIERLQAQHRDDTILVRDCEDEIAAVRSNYSSVLNDLDAEKARSEELSLELLNLVNTKNALMREREQLQTQRENILKMNSELEGRMAESQTELKDNAELIRQLQREVEELKTEKERARLEFEATKVQFQEQKLVADRTYASYEQHKGEELLSLKQELVDRGEEHKRVVRKLEEDMATVQAQFKQASRRAAEMENELNEKAMSEAQLQAETQELRQRMTQLSESYREKLHKYISDVSHLSTEVNRGLSSGSPDRESSVITAELRAAVDAMFQELVQTYGAREDHLQEELRRSREQSQSYARRSRKLYQAYRSLRYQLEDLAPKGVRPDLLDDAALLVEGEGSELERQQQQMIEELRDKLSEAEAQSVAKSERALQEAERYTAQAAQVQAKLSQQNREIADLKAKLSMTEEEARERRGEVQRVEERLLQELQELKTKGIAAPRAPSSSTSDAAVVDLQRQLDRSLSENERLRSDVDKLRKERAAMPAAANPEPCQSCGKKDTEIQRLQEELRRCQGQAEELKAKLAKGGGGGGGGGGGDPAKDAEIAKLQAEVKRLQDELSNDDLRAMISDFASGTQADLEAEVADLRTKNVMLEEEVEALRGELMKK